MTAGPPAGLHGCLQSCSVSWQADLLHLCLVFQDESVTQLGQELAQKLGLRVRKAYKRPQVGGLWVPGAGGRGDGESEDGVWAPLGEVGEGGQSQARTEGSDSR